MNSKKSVSEADKLELDRKKPLLSEQHQTENNGSIHSPKGINDSKSSHSLTNTLAMNAGANMAYSKLEG